MRTFLRVINTICLMLLTLLAIRLVGIARQINGHLAVASILAQQTSVNVAALPYALATVLRPTAVQHSAEDTGASLP